MSQFKFGPASSRRLASLDPQLEAIVRRALEITEEDFSVICGYRGELMQEKAFADGKSQARWGESKHNTYPSEAVDLAPWPIDWEDQERFEKLAKVMKQAAYECGVHIEAGIYWKFRDPPHYELVWAESLL